MSIGVEAKREAKHVRFCRGIEHLEKSIKRLAQLIDRVEVGDIGISTPEKTTERTPVNPMPSLLYFLNEQPEHLEKMDADLEVQIERLEQMLF